MSNLKLKNMSFASLLNLTEGKVGKDIRLGYKTTVYRAYGRRPRLLISHHGNVIAKLERISEADGTVALRVSGAGWNSRTTADRLTRILADNNVNAYVTSRNNKKEYGLFFVGRGRYDSRVDITRTPIVRYV